MGKSLAASVGSAGASTLGQDSALMSDTSVGSTASPCETSNIYRETWLVQEFCDKGSLSEFLQTGGFANSLGQGRNMVCEPHPRLLAGAISPVEFCLVFVVGLCV